MKILNQKTKTDYPYISGFKGTRVGLYAENLAKAKEQAIKHFSPNKKDINLVWVLLAEE